MKRIITTILLFTIFFIFNSTLFSKNNSNENDLAEFDFLNEPQKKSDQSTKKKEQDSTENINNNDFNFDNYEDDDFLSFPEEETVLPTKSSSKKEVSLGFKGGLVQIYKRSTKKYTSFAINPYALYHYSDLIGFSLNFDFCITNEEKESSTNITSKFTMYGLAGKAHFFFPITSRLNISLEFGGGPLYSSTDLTPPPDGIIGGVVYDSATVTNTSSTFYSDLSLSFNLEVEPVILHLSPSYKRIFYSDDPMNIYGVYLGIGYKL